MAGGIGFISRFLGIVAALLLAPPRTDEGALDAFIAEESAAVARDEGGLR
jgi:hypothetical protein